MNKQATIFLDYNETFDDIRDGKGKIFMSALSRFVAHFKGNVKIVVITAAPYNREFFNIRPEFKITMAHFPRNLRDKFAYLIEGNCQYVTPLYSDYDTIEFGDAIELKNFGTKKDGVEQYFRWVESKDQSSVCVFAGNNEESDLIMMDANIGDREKYFLLANRRVLKAANYPIYKLSMHRPTHTFSVVNDILENTTPPITELPSELIIKTGAKSYGLGRGFYALSDIAKEKERTL